MCNKKESKEKIQALFQKPVVTNLYKRNCNKKTSSFIYKFASSGNW